MRLFIELKHRFVMFVKEERKYLAILFAIGIVTHAFMILNKYSLNDDNDCWFRLGMTYSQGRWMLGVFEMIAERLGTIIVSAPWFNGLITIFFIALSACIICRVLDIRRMLLKVLVGAVMECVIEVAAMMGFAFTASSYALGLFLAVLASACWISAANTRKRPFLVCFGMICIACSLGLYQAYFAVNLCIMCLWYMNKSIMFETKDMRSVKISALVYGICCEAGGLLLYLLINKFFLIATGNQMISEQGMDKWGITDFYNYVKRFYYSYKAFFVPWKFNVNIHMELLKYLYPLVLAIFVLEILCVIVFMWKQNQKQQFIIFIMLLLIYPCVVNFHYILSDVSNIHGLMVYSQVFIYIGVINFAQKMLDIVWVNDYYKEFFYSVTIIITSLFALLSLRIDNILYFKAYAINANDVSYCTTLVTRIESIDGYDDDYGVCFYKWSEHQPKDFHYDWRFETIEYIPYCDQIISNQDMLFFLFNQSGYRPQMVFENELSDNILSQIDDMPTYPDFGSIQIIDNTIVVKMAE